MEGEVCHCGDQPLAVIHALLPVPLAHLVRQVHMASDLVSGLIDHFNIQQGVEMLVSVGSTELW